MELPLGLSSVSLTVRDTELDSPADTAAIQIAFSVQGFDPPMSSLVPDGSAPLKPRNAFKRGSTIPLKLQLTCGGRPSVTSTAPPQITALKRESKAVGTEPLVSHQSQGDKNPPSAEQQSLAFRLAGDKWVHELRTKDLQQGSYTIVIRMPDGLSYHAAFELR